MSKVLRPTASNNLDVSNIAFLIRNQRLNIGVSQEELALNVGCSVTHINRIESGRMPSLRLLFAICKELNLSSDKILGLNTYPSPQMETIQELLDQFTEEELVLVIHLLKDLHHFFTDMHHSTLYNRYSRTKRDYSLLENSPVLKVAEGEEEYPEDVPEEPKPEDNPVVPDPEDNSLICHHK